MTDAVAKWSTTGPLEDVVRVVDKGWHTYSVSSPYGRAPSAKTQGGYRYVWELHLGCGHMVLHASERYDERLQIPEAPRVARCPQCSS